MSSHVKAFMKKVQQSEEGRELTDRVLLSLRLGRLVYEMRTTASLSQEELAMSINSTQSAISRLESGNGGHVPGNELLENIAQRCGYHMTLRAEPIKQLGVRHENSIATISIDLNHTQGLEKI